MNKKKRQAHCSLLKTQKVQNCSYNICSQESLHERTTTTFILLLVIEICGCVEHLRHRPIRFQKPNDLFEPKPQFQLHELNKALILLPNMR